MKISRRYFLKSGGIAMVGMAALPSFLQRAVASTTVPGKKKMVVLFQRGAMDGLNVVVPFGEPNYYRMRPTIAIPEPKRGGSEAALDLDGFFGLHPSLQPMMPLFRSGQLAIVQAVGSPDPTRSHFDAQDYMESGTPGLKATDNGWLNRALLSGAFARLRRSLLVERTVILGIVIVVAITGKLGWSMFAARLAGMPWREAASLGILMNTRGLMELVILNIGLDIGVISTAMFSIMVLMALVTTFMTTPLLEWVYPTRLFRAQVDEIQKNVA